MTDLRKELERLAEEWEREAERRERDAANTQDRRALRLGASFERNHADRIRSLLASHPESAPAPGGERRCVECGHTWESHVLTERGSDCLGIDRMGCDCPGWRPAAPAPGEDGDRDEAARTVRSLATMLGWVNVPPRESLEANLRALLARVREQDQRLTKAREALRELLDHCDEEVDGEQGEDTVCIMCGGGDPCAPDCPAGRARAVLKSLEGA